MTIASGSTFPLLSFEAACAWTNNPPPAREAGDRTGGPIARVDSTRANKVIENSRPDAPARAGFLVVANQLAATATVLNAATLQVVATLAVGAGPHEVAVTPEGHWALCTNYVTHETPRNT